MVRRSKRQANLILPHLFFAKKRSLDCCCVSHTLEDGEKNIQASNEHVILNGALKDLLDKIHEQCIHMIYLMKDQTFSTMIL